MQAIEFDTFINNKAIHIPKQFQIIDNVKVKVIMLYGEPEITGNYNKQELLSVFSRAEQKGIFNKISNSVTWQKQLRDEWE